MKQSSQIRRNLVFVRIKSDQNNHKIDLTLFLDPFAHQNSLHRRIHSDPLLPIQKNPIELNRSCVDSPIPTENSFLDDLSIKQEESIPSMSYSQTEDYGSYPSSYDSRGGENIETRKQPKLTLGKANNSEQNRHSISSQITLVDEQDQSLYDHHLPTIGNNDETSLSIASTSPRDRSTTIDYSTRSKCINLPTAINSTC